MAIVLDDNYFKPLDEFFAKNTVTNVNRDAYLACNLFDKANNIHISLVFLRDWDSLETDSFNQVIIQGKGAVFTFPCYWISIPKELAFTYIKYIVQAFYDDEVSKLFNIDKTTLYFIKTKKSEPTKKEIDEFLIQVEYYNKYEENIFFIKK